MERQFQNRQDAGQQLAGALELYRQQTDTVVLGLPRGGVPVAYEVASRLQLPLDVLIVRKVGLPSNPELAMGAVASGGVEIINDTVTDHWGINKGAFSRVAQQELTELGRREEIYRRGLPPLAVKGKTVILVDDGIATGSTVRAAVSALRELHAGKIVIAVPVASPQTAADLRTIADEVHCLSTPEHFYAVGQVYYDFGQTPDSEVCDLLQQARTTHSDR